MNKLFALLLVVASSTSFATTHVKCTFTEPFFDLNVDLQTKEVTEVTPDWDNIKENEPIKYVTKLIAKDVKLETNFEDVLLPKYQVSTQDGQVIATFVMNMKGSDGMSDIVFPLDVNYKQYYGGCSTDLIKAVNPYE